MIKVNPAVLQKLIDLELVKFDKDGIRLEDMEYLISKYPALTREPELTQERRQELFGSLSLKLSPGKGEK